MNPDGEAYAVIALLVRNHVVPKVPVILTAAKDPVQVGRRTESSRDSQGIGTPYEFPDASFSINPGKRLSTALLLRFANHSLCSDDNVGMIRETPPCLRG
jgi:hypothetical protein